MLVIRFSTHSILFAKLKKISRLIPVVLYVFHIFLIDLDHFISLVFFRHSTRAATTHFKISYRDSRSSIERFRAPLTQPTMDTTTNGAVTVVPVVLTASSSLIKSGPFGRSPSPHQSQANYANVPLNGASGPTLSLKVNIKDLNLSKTLQFQASTIVFDALKMLREKVPEINTTEGKWEGVVIKGALT